MSARIRAVQEIEAAGAEVLVVAADIADRDQMAALVDRAVARFGRLDGVIHAAGVAGAGTIQLKKREGEGSVLAALEDIDRRNCEAQFRPKVRGLFVLEEVLGDRPLDFCLVVSSLSTLTGGPGYAAYAAANMFMDAFVRRHNQQSAVRWLGVNWDAWSFQAAGASSSAVSRMTLSEAEGIEVFERLLSVAPLGHVIVSTINLYARLSPPAEQKKRMTARRRRTPAGTRSTTGPPAWNRATKSPGRRSNGPWRASGRKCWGWTGSVDADSFFELGGHSLLAVQVAARLEDVLQMEVPMRNVFDASTLADLADAHSGRADGSAGRGSARRR